MKKILFIVTLIASIFIINNFVRSIYSLWQKKEFIVRAQKELEMKKKENQELKAKLDIVQNKDFVEEEARNKLLLVKQGEKRVVIDERLIREEEKKKSLEQKTGITNLREWWKLFFN